MQLFNKNCYLKCDRLKDSFLTIQSLTCENNKLQLNEKLLIALENFHEYHQNICHICKHNGEFVIITVENEFKYKGYLDKINFYAYVCNIYSKKFKRVQTLYSELRYSHDTYELPKSIYIIDFLGEMNKGYGSIVMTQFLTYIKSLNLSSIKKVTGFLSYVDNDHWDLLIHFYQKFGFKIADDQTALKKNIILDLSDKEEGI